MASINLTKAELKAGVKGIIPQTNEGIVLSDERRRYRRIRHTPREKLYLANKGFQHVESSNVSAVKRVGKHLHVRFLNGSVYRYFGQGYRINDILQSNSKGKWVWQQLRRKNVRYQKIGSLPMPRDVEIDDKKLFKDIDNKVNKLGAIVGSTVLANVIDKKTGISFRKVAIGGLILRMALESQNNQPNAT